MKALLEKDEASVGFITEEEMNLRVANSPLKPFQEFCERNPDWEAFGTVNTE